MYKFEYIKKPFLKKQKQPLSENEYKILRDQYEDFMHLFDKKNQDYEKEYIIDMYNFEKRIYILLGVLTTTLFVYLSHRINLENMYLSYLLFFFYALCLFFIVKDFLYFLSYLLSKKEFSLYKFKFNKYYKYHYSLVCETSSYKSYLQKLKIKVKLL